MPAGKRRFAKSAEARNAAMLAPMKAITPILRGLTSSLLLNAGLTKVAEKLDPVADNQVKLSNAGGLAAFTCCPSAFTARRR
jgi:hypothetical protein